jgi:hypothetical protein
MTIIHQQRDILYFPKKKDEKTKPVLCGREVPRIELKNTHWCRTAEMDRPYMRGESFSNVSGSHTTRARARSIVLSVEYLLYRWSRAAVRVPLVRCRCRCRPGLANFRESRNDPAASIYVQIHRVSSQVHKCFPSTQHVPSNSLPLDSCSRSFFVRYVVPTPIIFKSN